MKKLLLLIVGLGIFVVSCGTKESTLQNNNSDSTAVSPAKVDTLKIDSTAMPPATR